MSKSLVLRNDGVWCLSKTEFVQNRLFWWAEEMLDLFNPEICRKVVII